MPKGSQLPPSFQPAFDDVSNPLRVDPIASANQGIMDPSSADVLELDEDALEPIEEPAQPQQVSAQPQHASVPPQHASVQPQHASAPPPARPSAPPGSIPPGPSDLLHSVPPPPDEHEPLDPELDPATYEAPTFVRPSLIEQDPVPVVEIIQGNEAGRSYRFEKDAISIGRSLDNDIVLTDIAVSRRHMRLTRQGNNVQVEDMGSGNGTLINGVKMARSPLGPSDRVEVGNTIYRIVFPGQESMPANPLSLGASSQQQSANPLHQKSTAFLPQGQSNQLMQQIGVAQQSQPAHSSPPVDYQAPAVSPSAPPGFTSQPPAEQYQTGSQPAVQVQPMQAPAHSVTPHAPPQTAPAERTSPKSFKLAMTILAVGMLVIGTVAIVAAVIHVRNRGGSEEVSSDELFAQGTKAYVERRWGHAANSFEQVLALSPANSKAREYLGKARAEERNQGTLEAARQALSEENYEDAVSTLRTIPRSSVYAPEAIEMRTDAEERHAKTLVADARRLREDDRERALSKLDRALKLSPTNSDARELRRELLDGGDGGESDDENEESPAGATPTPGRPAVAKAPASRPTAGGSGAARPPRRGSTNRGSKSTAVFSSVISQYKSGNFAGAVARADELAASASSDSDRAKARSLSRKIQRFSQAFSGSKSTSNPRQKMRHLENALSLDRQISGGHYAGQLRPQLRDFHVGNAQRAWRARQYASACQSALRALKLDRNASAAAQVSRQCESKAREFYSQGESLRSSNLTQAKNYWRKVLNMVPRSNPWYSKAYSSLNNSGRRRYQDEDE